MKSPTDRYFLEAVVILGFLTLYRPAVAGADGVNEYTKSVTSSKENSLFHQFDMEGQQPTARHPWAPGVDRAAPGEPDG